MDAIKSLFENICRQAAIDGSEVELLLTGGESLTLRYQKRQLKTFDSTQSQMAGLRVLYQNQQGYAYTERLDEESLLRTYREAFENSKSVKKPVAIEISLVQPSKVPTVENVQLQGDNSLDEKMKIAEKVESLCLEKDKRIESVPYLSFSERKGFKRIMNSNGLDQKFESGVYSAHSYPLAKEGESSKMAGRTAAARKLSDLDIEKMTTLSVEDATSLLGARALKTGTYAVVIRSDQANMVLSMIDGYFSAKNVDQKTSLYKDKLNQEVASSKWNLIDNALKSGGLASRPFDDEGSPSQETVLIENGRLKNFLTNSEYSKKMSLPLTAHASRSPNSEMDIAPSNLLVSLGDKTREQLLSKYPNCVLITNFAAGLHSGFKATTGDISMPCEGILYEKGKPIRAVDQFILSVNIIDLMKQTEEMGNSYSEDATSYHCPDILIGHVKLAGS